MMKVRLLRDKEIFCENAQDVCVGGGEGLILTYQRETLVNGLWSKLAGKEKKEDRMRRTRS